jgi:hypothetical protein
MAIKTGIALTTVLLAAAAATATPTLQLDVNGFQIQAVDGAGASTAFGGLTHTGALKFSFTQNVTELQAVLAQTVPAGPFVNQGFSGTLANFSGQVNLVNGQVTGGSIVVSVNGGADTYQTNIMSWSGQVASYVGGGYKIEGLTSGGAFSDSMFGNVDVSPWFAVQGGGGLLGSFLEFNFDPDAQGAGYSDMDLFVEVVPLPPAVLTGMATLGGIVAVRRIRRR